MRIAAGVLILIAAVMDLLGGAGYLILGGVAAAGGQVADAVNKAQQIQFKDMPAKQAQAATDTLKFAGSIGLAFGAFLWVLTGLAIACGVVLFREKAAVFALIVGVLQLMAEGVPLATFGFNPFQIPGIVAGILVIVAAVSYPKKQPAMTM